MSLVNWKIAFATYFGLLWLCAVLINVIGLVQSWDRGYGRVWMLLPFAIELPFGIVSLPLTLLFVLVLQPFKDIVLKNLHLFALSLLLLACCTACSTVSIAIMQEHMMTDLEVDLVTLLNHNYGHSSSNNDSALSFTQSMDYVQNKFECCGVRGDGDYKDSNWFKIGDPHGQARNVPPSCCVPETSGNNNISHSGSPISVVSRVFYNMLEEGWQKPQAKDRNACQSPEHNIHKQARYKQVINKYSHTIIVTFIYYIDGCKEKGHIILDIVKGVGCLPFIEVWLKKDITLTLIAGICICVFQLLGVCISLILRKQFQRQAVEANPENNGPENH